MVEKYLHINFPKYNIQVEKQHPSFKMQEIPDFYIETANRIIIGFNQIDLWNGGAQLNRASKYILSSPKIPKNIRIVYVMLTDPAQTQSLDTFIKNGGQNG